MRRSGNDYIVGDMPYLMLLIVGCLNIISTNSVLGADTYTVQVRPKVALALGGGGTRGAAHIGVLRVLAREGIPIDCVCGTSMGAIIGGLYAAGVSLSEIESIFKSKSILHHFYTVPVSLRVALIPLFFLPHLVGYHPYDGLYRGGIFAHFLERLAEPDKRTLENLKHPIFWAVASNLLDGEPYTIKTGSLGKALQASSAIPELRRPVEFEDKLLVDGGVIVNLPVQEARNMGCDLVIAVDVDQAVAPMDKHQFKKLGAVSWRCINMNLRAVDRPQVKLADIVISPNLENINLLSTRKVDVDQAIKAGEEAAEKALPLIKARTAPN
jgi:NTE family protein